MALFNKSYVSSLASISSNSVHQIDNLSYGATIDSSDPAAARSSTLVVNANQSDEGVKNGQAELFFVNLPNVKHVFIECNKNPIGVKATFKNCPDLEYIEMGSQSGNHVSIVCDKTEEASGDREASVISNESDNKLMDSLFINAVIDELFVMWGGAKQRKVVKSIHNSVTHDSKLLPSEAEGMSEDEFKKRGGKWKYDIFEEFTVEPNIVYEKSQLDSVFIGKGLSSFDFNDLYVDAVILDNGKAGSRSNPAAVVRSKGTPRAFGINGSTLNVDIKVLFVRNIPELNAIDTIKIAKSNRALYAYDMPNLNKIIGNDVAESKIDVGNVPNLTEITNCSIEYVGLNDFPSYKNRSQDAEIVLDGAINKLYAENVLIKKIICQDIQQYFVVGENAINEAYPSVLQFYFTTSGASRKNPYGQSSRARKNPLTLNNKSVSDTQGVQLAVNSIQSLLGGEKANVASAFSIVPESTKTIDILIQDFPGAVAEIESLDSILNQYLNGASKAVTPKETMYAIVYLARMLAHYTKENPEEYLLNSELIDRAWQARTICLSSLHGTKPEACSTWTWNFYRNDGDDSRDNEELKDVYKEAWMSDLSLYYHATLFGSKATQRAAAAWAEKALPNAFAPVQIWAMINFAGVKREIFEYLAGMFAQGFRDAYSTEFQSRLQQIAAINQKLYDFVLQAIGNVPYSYDSIKLSLSAPTTAYAYDYPKITAVSITNFNLVDSSAVKLMYQHVYESRINYNLFASKFNNEMLLEVFLILGSEPKKLSNVLVDAENSKALLRALINAKTGTVNSYIYKFPITLDFFIPQMQADKLSSSIVIDDSVTIQIMDLQGYPDATQNFEQFKEAFSGGAYISRYRQEKRRFNLGYSSRR